MPITKIDEAEGAGEAVWQLARFSKLLFHPGRAGSGKGGECKKPHGTPAKMGSWRIYGSTRHRRGHGEHGRSHRLGGMASGRNHAGGPGTGRHRHVPAESGGPPEASHIPDGA